MKVSKLSDEQHAKVVKTVLYVVLSSSVSGLIAVLAEQPELFGYLTPVINVLLVAGKQFLTDSK